MNRDEYLNLTYKLSEASKKFKNNEDYNNELNKAIVSINKYMENSSNVAKTAYEIENLCLEYDRNINLRKNIDKIDSRLTGCLAAIKDLNDLQVHTEKYIKDYQTFQPYNLNAETTYTKEAFNSLKYLGTEKNANYTNEAGYNFYEKRQDIIKQGRQAFLKEKKQVFEHIQSQPKEKKLDKNKGLER